MTFPSPSRRAAVEIWQTWPDNSWGAKAELVTGQRRIVLEQMRRDPLIYFVHVYWSPDEAKVGVVATGYNYWHLAYDVRAGKELPFDQMRKDISQSIRQTYNLPQEETDPIQWAAMADAQAEFFRRHPEIRLSYR